MMAASDVAQRAWLAPRPDAPARASALYVSTFCGKCSQPIFREVPTCHHVTLGTSHLQ